MGGVEGGIVKVSVVVDSPGRERRRDWPLAALWVLASGWEGGCWGAWGEFYG